MMVFEGGTKRLTVTFGTAGADPTTVTLIVTAPAGTTTTYTYPAGITKTGDRAYQRDLSDLVAGIYSWEWIGTGTNGGNDSGTFAVERTMPGESLVSVETIKLQMETEVTTSDDVLQRYAVEAAMAIQQYLGRRIRPIDAAATDRYFDADDSWDPRRRELWVWDLSAAPTEVVVIDSAGDTAATLTVADDVILHPRNRQAWEPVERLRLRPSASLPTPGQEIRVRGIWGWPAIPEDVAGACIVTVRSWLRQAPVGGGYDEFGEGRPMAPAPAGGWMLPMAAKQRLRPYRRMGIA